MHLATPFTDRRVPRSSLVALATALLLAAAGCEGDGTGDGLPAPPAAGTWAEVAPGGRTICARGTDYRFFVRGGRPDRIIIDFEGGGACWNGSTCAIGSSLFNQEVGTLEDFEASPGTGGLSGIFDGDPSSPFADWTLVHVPYCTGDIHWGDSSQDYGDGVAIEHRGFVNVNAVLDWVYSRYPAPENVFVTGCSAGAYGAIVHSAYIAQAYPDAAVSVLADSGSGIITEDFLLESLPNWNAEGNLPLFVGGLEGPLEDLSLPKIYTAIGRFYPQHRFAQTGTAFDADQTFFYSVMGGAPEDWPRLFRESVAEIDSGLDNFSSFISGGSMHCLTPYPFFETETVDGRNLEEWAEQLAVGDTMPPSANCEGEACCEAPVCDDCAVSGDPWCRFCQAWPPPHSGCAPPAP